MNELVQIMLPELILIGAACVLFILGISSKVAARKAAPWIAVAALVGVLVVLLRQREMANFVSDGWNTFRIGSFALYVKMLTAAVGIMLALLAWPTNSTATGSSAMNFGHEAGEFFALLLLSLAGVLVAGANDMILLFLGIELASIPTYIMVSISRPIPAAQEAGVKYFFLGAMAAAVMLFGFSYLYGTTGLTNLNQIAALFRETSPSGQSVTLNAWQMLAAVMLIAGFGFKIAAVPLHFYVGDVYQGAATPVTAFLAFVPKISGFVAIIKLLHVFGGGGWDLPHQIGILLWILAVLTMFAGNLLALMQYNVKRVLAYSSVAHSGYMLVGLATLAMAQNHADVQNSALQGVLFYLAAYGVMNAAAFGVLMLLPAREPKAATSAETLEDIAGQGRNHLLLGLAMAVSCFSLTGLPLTVGFFGKLYLIKPALLAASADPSIKTMMIWLVVLTMINAAISAAYYLRIVAALFLRPEPTLFGESKPSNPAPIPATLPVTLSITVSVIATMGLGIVPAAIQRLSDRTESAATSVDSPAAAPATVMLDR
jgi:NADH-quinone oxidoreductase subunit N